MKITRILSTLLMMVILCNCTTKTNKTSRQFENLVETTAISKDGKELSTYSRNFYVFESKRENLFDEKGFFISKNNEADELAKVIVRSGVRNVIEKYTLDSLLNLNKLKFGSAVKTYLHNTNMEDTTQNFNIRFNGILIEKITPKKDL